ncbi:MAG: hypothetical protein ACI33S_05985 [Bacilli bacterium]
MIAVKMSDYTESGCVNCGCEYCYSDNLCGQTISFICAECNTSFLAVSDDLQMSSIGFSKDSYDGLIIKSDSSSDITSNTENNIVNANSFNEIVEKYKNGIAIEKDNIVYPIVGKHPRKGTLKHKFVRPDIRPGNGEGDFCNPRGVGYNLTCFVKSKEAGQRITDMINKINKEYDNKGFSCWLDYREYEPLWIQVKINYPNETKAKILADLIADNGNIITEDIVRKAMDMQIDFATYWKYEVSSAIYKLTSGKFLHEIIGTPEDLSQEERNKIYEYSFYNNYLDQFEIWGACKQIELELEKGNIEKAVIIAKHIIDLNCDHFNFELMLQREKDYYINKLREYIHMQLVYAVNIHYKRTKKFKIKPIGMKTCDYIKIKDYANISDDMKQQFLSDWQNLVPMIFKVIDIEALKTATDMKMFAKNDKEEIEKINQVLNKYPNLYEMFSLYGLYVQVSKNIEDGQIENAILALLHVVSQQNSPLFKKLQMESNDKISLQTQMVYFQISNLVSKYYGKQNQTVTHRKLFKLN